MQPSSLGAIAEEPEPDRPSVVGQSAYQSAMPQSSSQNPALGQSAAQMLDEIDCSGGD